MRSTRLVVMLACALAAGSTTALAVSLPDTSYNTTFTASVMEQADISVPDQIIFDVTDITADTDATGLTVSATSVALVDGNALRIEIIAEGDDFLPPGGGLVTYSAGDVSWDAAAWTGGTGSAGTLSGSAYTKVADSGVNATELSSDAVTWTLASRAVDAAGNYDISTIWRFTSFTP